MRFKFNSSENVGHKRPATILWKKNSSGTLSIWETERAFCFAKKKIIVSIFESGMKGEFSFNFVTSASRNVYWVLLTFENNKKSLTIQHLWWVYERILKGFIVLSWFQQHNIKYKTLNLTVILNNRYNLQKPILQKLKYIFLFRFFWIVRSFFVIFKRS